MFTSTNPATGQAGDTFDMMDDAAVEAALKRAQAAFKAWRVSEMQQRVNLLNGIADRFDANKQHLAETAVREMGKTLASAVAEVEKCVAAFRHFAEHGPGFLTDETVKTSTGRTIAQWQPIGPILAIMPWNFPYWQAVRWLAPTILAGNVGLLKHASLTQGCAALIQQMVQAAGAPDGLFQNLPIKSNKIARIIADDRVAAVTLTGSEGAGVEVAQAAGKALKKVVLELGGSDPFIVMPSADLDAAVKAAVKARIQNAGQSCICAKRMIVHGDVYDAFAARFIAAMAAVKIGDPMDEGVEMGPLSSIEQRDTVLEQVERAVASGATRHGAERIDRDGAWMTAGVLTGVDPDADFAQEEVFGPVAMLFRADSIDAAVDLANDVPFGLGSSAWSADQAEIDRFVRDIAAGMVAVNQMLVSSPESPFGGVKRSGHGRELGPWGLHEFMNLKAVMLAG